MFSLNPKNWFKEKESKKGETKSAYLPLEQGSFLEYALGSPGATISAQMANGFYRNTSAIATAVDMIADSVKLVQPVIEDSEGKIITDHEIIRFLKKPNGMNLYHDFMGTLARNYLLKHDSLITCVGNIKRPPIEIWPVSYQEVSVLENLDTYPDAYIVPTGSVTGTFTRSTDRKLGTKFYDGNLKEIYHIKGFSSERNNIQSDSPLQASANEARQIIKGKLHNLSLLDNGGRLSLLISFNDEDMITESEHDQRKQRIQEDFGGNAGKIGVISGADISSVKEFGVNNKDMDYAELETFAGYAIYLRYNVPLALVTNDAATFNNMQTGIELLYDMAIIPLANILFEGLSDLLLHRFGLDPKKFKITYNPESIDALKKRKIEEVKKRQEIGVETDNELRSLLPNREPVEGGDVLYKSSNFLPIGTDLYTDDNNAT